MESELDVKINLPENVEDLLPRSILRERIKFIQEKEDLKLDSEIRFWNLFSNCANCNKRIWVGRDKSGGGITFPDAFYIFDDLPRITTGLDGKADPVCFDCAGKCFCNDNTFRLNVKCCLICEQRQCTLHFPFRVQDTICQDCHTYFMLGKMITKLLLEKKPTSFEQLYQLLDSQ